MIDHKKELEVIKKVLDIELRPTTNINEKYESCLKFNIPLMYNENNILKVVTGNTVSDVINLLYEKKYFRLVKKGKCYYYSFDKESIIEITVEEFYKNVITQQDRLNYNFILKEKKEKEKVKD